MSNPGSGQDEEPKPRLNWEDVARPAAALALLTTFLAAISASGILDQAQRNHSWWLYVAAVLVLTTGVLWALSLLAKDFKATRKWIFAVVAVVFAVIAVLVPIAASSSETVTWSDTTRQVVGFLVAVALVALLAALGVPQTKNKTPVAPVLASVAVATLAAGLLSGMVAIVQSQKDAPRPTVTASIKDGPVDVADREHQRSGHQLGQACSYDVDAITWKRNQRTGRPMSDSRGYIVTQERQRLYSVWLGPDKSGDIDHKIELVIPPTLRDEVAIHAWVVETLPEECVSEESPEGDCPQEQPPPCNRFAGGLEAGCLRLRLLPASARPRISAGLKRAGDGFTLAAKVQAQRVHEGRRSASGCSAIAQALGRCRYCPPESTQMNLGQSLKSGRRLSRRGFGASASRPRSSRLKVTHRLRGPACLSAPRRRFDRMECTRRSSVRHCSLSTS